MLINIWDSVRHGQSITGLSENDRAKTQCSEETLNTGKIQATLIVQSLSMYMWIAWINTAHHVSYGHKTVNRLQIANSPSVGRSRLETNIKHSAFEFTLNNVTVINKQHSERGGSYHYNTA